MAIATDKLGQTIYRDKADLLFDRLIQIKKRSVEKIRKALDGDDEAIRYYCGREDKSPVTEDLAYIFDRASIKRVLATMDAHGAHGIIIFNGVRSREDSRLDNGTYNDVDGRPTLMMFPCIYHETKTSQNSPVIQFENLVAVGEEHPGTGDGNGTTPSPTLSPARLPDLYQPEEVHTLGFI